MNLFILTIILFLLSIISLLIMKGDFLSPIALSFESFFLVSFIAFIYNGFTGADISLQTMMIIISALFIFSFAFLFTLALFQNKFDNKVEKKCKYIYIKNGISLFFILIELVALLLNYNYTLSLARSVYSGATILNMLQYARTALLFMDVSSSYFISFLVFFVSALGYLYVFIFCNNYISKLKVNKFNSFLSITIILLSLILGMLGTGRTFLIKFIAITITMIFYLSLVKRNNKISFKFAARGMKKVCIVLITFFAIFQLMGVTTGKTNTVNTKDMLYLYSGASIIALDKSIEKYTKDDRFFGEESFYGLYSLLNNFGINVPNSILHLPFVETNEGMRTNIYSSIKTYLYDFGFIGIYIVQLILGCFSGLLYILLSKFKTDVIYLFVYGIVIYGFAMQGIAETIIRNFMSLTNVCTLLCLAFLHLLLIKKIHIKI